MQANAPTATPTAVPDPVEHQVISAESAALPHQPGVHRAVEPFVIDDIVGMAVGVIVRPAGADREPHVSMVAREPGDQLGAALQLRAQE